MSKFIDGLQQPPGNQDSTKFPSEINYPYGVNKQKITLLTLQTGNRKLFAIRLPNYCQFTEQVSCKI